MFTRCQTAARWHNIVLWRPAARLQMQNLNTHLKLPSAVSTRVINFPGWPYSQTTTNAALVTFKTPFKAIVISARSVQTSKCSWLTLLIIVAGRWVINILGAKCTFLPVECLHPPLMDSHQWGLYSRALLTPTRLMIQTHQSNSTFLIHERQHRLSSQPSNARTLTKVLTWTHAACRVGNSRSFSTSVAFPSAAAAINNGV